MKQRNDLLAVSLLMFSAIFTVWLTLMPVSLDGLQRWQTLIGGIITGVGVLIASWNVTRQMRLAARGREQDRIEREIPGNRAAHQLAARILGSGKAPNKKAEAVYSELDELNLRRASVSEFPARFDDLLPGAPDGTKRGLGQLIYSVRAAVAIAEAKRELWMRAEREVQLAGLREGKPDLATRQADAMAAKAAHVEAIAKFDERMAALSEFRNALWERIAADRTRLERLRALHEKYLGL